MEGDVETYKSCTDSVITCLMLFGVWPKTHPVLKRIAYAIAFASTFSVMAMALNFSYHNGRDVMLLVKGLASASSFASIFSKVVLFYQHQDELVYLNEHMSRRFNSDMSDPANLPDLLLDVQFFAKFGVMHKTSIAFAMSMYCVMPIVGFVKHGKYLRVYPCLYPFSFAPGGVVHWLLYAFESMGALYAWIITIGADCAFGLYAMQICGEQRILARKFREIEFSENYRRQLRDCMERHHLIISAKNKFEDLYGLISIWLAVSGAIVLCSLIFQVTELLKNDGSYIRAAIFFAHFSGKVLQVFIYAWYGNLINDESSAFPRAVYGSYWTDCTDIRFKNDLLIILAQQPLIVTAKGCMNIQLDMFAKIVKTSMSYFFLLQTLKTNAEN